MNQEFTSLPQRRSHWQLVCEDSLQTHPRFCDDPRRGIRLGQCWRLCAAESFLVCSYNILCNYRPGRRSRARPSLRQCHRSIRGRAFLASDCQPSGRCESTSPGDAKDFRHDYGLEVRGQACQELPKEPSGMHESVCARRGQVHASGRGQNLYFRRKRRPTRPSGRREGDGGRNSRRKYHQSGFSLIRERPVKQWLVVSC